MIPRKKPLKGFVQPDNVVVVYGTVGNFNESVIVDSLVKRLLVPFKLTENLDKIHLIMDHAPCHTTKVVQNSCLANNIEITYVPKRLTNMLQPADVAWMRSLKRAFYNLWDDWMMNAPKSHTKSGNLKSPGYAKVILWISQIWYQLDTNLLVSSFDKCGITSENKEDYHRQLRHFIDTNELTEDIDEDDVTSCFNGFYEEDKYRKINYRILRK